MVYEFKFPDVGEGITEGRLVTWKVKVGDMIKTDDSVADVETDKATVGIPTPVSGKVVELLGNEGDMLDVGNVFMKIDESGESSDSSSGKQEEVPKNSASFEIEEVEDVSTIELKDETKKDNTFYDVAQKKWIKRAIGEEESISQVSLEEKVEPHPEREEHVKKILEQTQEAPVQEVKEEHIAQKVESSAQDGILAMPNVRHEAKQKGIDLSSIKGSGNHGQILLSDLNGGDVQTLKSSETQKGQEVQEAPVVEEQTPEVPAQEVTEEISDENTTKEETLESHRVVSTPSVRKLARELDIDINFVLGTGHNSRVTEEDVRRAKEAKDNKGKTTTTTTPVKTPVQEAPVVKAETPEQTMQSEVVDRSQASGIISYKAGIRGAIAKNMMASLQKTAQVTMCEEVDVSELVELRSKEKENLAQQGVKLTYLPFFMKAFIETARKYPQFNALLDDNAEELHLREDFHIGIAVDTDKGLTVPVIKNADKKSILDLAKEVIDVAKKSRTGTLSLSEMQGGTFTISSVGSMAGQFFTPILNYPQSAILGIGRIIKKPVVKGLDHIDIADMVSLSLTFDHRVIDGADAAKFMKELKTVLEDPLQLFMGM